MFLWKNCAKIDVISEQDCDFGMQTSIESSNPRYMKVVFENWSQYLVIIVYREKNQHKSADTVRKNFDFNFEYLYRQFGISF